MLYYTKMKYRPSPRFLKIMLPACTLLAALIFGVLPDLKEADARATPGEIVLPDKKPFSQTAATTRPISSISRVARGNDLLKEGWENLMAWEYNPWKKPKSFPGDHYRSLRESNDPVDRARAKEMARLAQVWHDRLMERYPELAVTPRPVPDERNAFLQWVEFYELMKALAKGTDKAPNIALPKEIEDLYINRKTGAVWSADAARGWLESHRPLMDKLRTMGLMTEVSSTGIEAGRYSFLHGYLVNQCMTALTMEGRLAAESGDTTAALESIRAAKGFADHLVQIESPTLLGKTVQFMMQWDLERRVLTEILPSLPAGSRDIAAWETIVNPTPHTPAEFARMMKGEWSTAIREWILPPVLDPGDPKRPPDGGALLDAFTRPYAELVRTAQTAKPGDGIPTRFDAEAASAGLSRESREMLTVLWGGTEWWGKGMGRMEQIPALSRAAFAVLKGGPMPVDPIHGQPYQWDPVSRTLSMPAGPEFDRLEIKPIVLPKLK